MNIWKTTFPVKHTKEALPYFFVKIWKLVSRIQPHTVLEYLDMTDIVANIRTVGETSKKKHVVRNAQLEAIHNQLTSLVFVRNRELL